MKKIWTAAFFVALGLFVFAACAQKTSVQTDETMTGSTWVMQAETETQTEAQPETTAEETDVPTAAAATQTTAAPAPPTAAPRPTTTAVPAPPAKASDGTTDYAFTTSSFKMGAVLDDRSFPRGTVITSADEMDAFVKDNEDAYGFRQWVEENPDCVQPYIEVFAQYNDAWFATHQLVVAEVEATSGSYRHTVKRVTRTPEGKVAVEVERSRPAGAMTCDMAYWFFFAEMETKDFRPADTVTVTIVST